MQLLEMDGTTTTVIWDRGFTANGFIRKFNSTYYAFGGEYIDDTEGEWQNNDPRDGVHVVRHSTLGSRDDPAGTDSIYGGAWMHPSARRKRRFAPRNVRACRGEAWCGHATW